MEDSQIIEAFLARKECAIAEVSHTYGSYCAAIARRILEAEEDVEEVLSDTWLRVWNSIPPEKPGSLKLYLARITRNLALDRFRSQTRIKRGGGETALALEELGECAGAASGPEEALVSAQLQQAVNRFVGNLPKRDRQIFLLRYFYLESAEEIGQRLGIRPALVRTVLSRTRKKLKNHLEKEGYLNGAL